MARSRNLKPGFFLNESLADIPPLGRLLFQGLWLNADREGRLEDRPKRLKAEILPYDDCDADALLTTLHEAGFIIRYRNCSVSYIQIVTFKKHQNPHVREPASMIPAPDEHSESTVLAQCKVALDPRSKDPKDSVLLKSSNTVSDESDTYCANHVHFEEFWSVYPRHENKKRTVQVWDRKRLDEKYQTILADVNRRKATHGQWLDGIIPHASTYLNGERWQDDINPARKNAYKQPKANTQPPIEDRLKIDIPGSGRPISEWT